MGGSFGRLLLRTEVLRWPLTLRTVTLRAQRLQTTNESTPTSGIMVCSVDFNGKQVWHQDLGPMDPLHGIAGSPLLYRDRVIISRTIEHPPDRLSQHLTSERAKKMWWTKRQAKSNGWGSRVAVRVGDHDEIIVSGENG